MNDFTLYLVLSQTGTLPSRFFKCLTQAPYNHVSISLDASLAELYSFARRTPNNPLNAGFIQESIETGIFYRYPDTRCQIYALTVTPAQYLALIQQLKTFKRNPQAYHYNFLGLPFLYVNQPLHRRHHYVCSQFVAYLLEGIGVSLTKDYTLYRPHDFTALEGLQFVYEGNLAAYVKGQRRLSLSPPLLGLNAPTLTPPAFMEEPNPTLMTG